MTTTTTAGGTATFSLGPFDIFTLTSASYSTGSLAFTSLAPKIKSDFVDTNPNSGVYGPYGVPMSVVLTVTGGSVGYDITAQSLTVSQVAAVQSLVLGAGTSAALVRTQAATGASGTRSPNPVVLYEGDSITARGITTVPGGFPATGSGLPATLPIASVSIGYQNVGYDVWERVFTGGICSYTNNGVSGNTILQIKTRLLATTLTSYDCVSVMAGINNVSASYTTVALGIAGAVTDYADIVSMVEYVRGYGIPLRILTVSPRDATGWPQAGQSPYWRKLNSLIRQLPTIYPAL